jgi:hypothetical protein
MERIKTFVEALLKASNLDENRAKTLIYYCIMTWSEEPKIRPILDIHGESGTGKNTIMKQIMPWCNEAKWINARNKTSPQLRNDMADELVVFVEEADKTKDPKLCANWYQCRYDETGKEIPYMRPGTGYKEETHDHYGYTVLHTQNDLDSIELDRRILRITLFKDSDRLYEPTDDLEPKVLKKIAKQVDWKLKIDQKVSNSAWDVWLPVMRVATFLGDDDFLEYVKKQIKAKVKEDEDTKTFEPKGLVLSETVPLYLAAIENKKVHVAITDIRAELSKRAYIFSEREIAKYARELGFKIVKPRNKAHVKVEGEARLKEILKTAGVYNSFYDDEGNLKRSASPKSKKIVTEKPKITIPPDDDEDEDDYEPKDKGTNLTHAKPQNLPKSKTLSKPWKEGDVCDDADEEEETTDDDPGSDSDDEDEDEDDDRW